VTGEPRRSRRLIPFLAVTAFLTIARSPVAAQSLDLYVAIADQYASGDEAGALNRSAESGFRIPSEISSHGRTLADRQLRSAIMVHTELGAVLLVNRRFGQATTQINSARRLIGMLTDDMRRRTAAKAFTIRWYAFAVNLYASQAVFDQAFQLTREGMSIYPNAADLFVAQGAVSEMRASLADSRRMFNVYGEHGMSNAVRNYFEAAAREYTQALSIDPHHAFAHLHQGWVHHRVSDDRAAEDLEAAVRDATDDGVRYLAHLFLGAEAERRDNLQEALRQFEAARQLGPGQSAAVALSRVEAALGHTDRARAITLEYARQPTRVEDPWWNYLLGGFEPGAIGWLRAEARRP
jgi:tetratricopeptide (TPR) repeat protein